MFEDRRFTYRELNEMSNSLAHILRERGIGRGDIVPIISVRSWHIIVAMLGILKAGGAYMPVSPEYPRDRVEVLLKEGKCKLACTYHATIPLHNVEILELGEVDYASNTNKIEHENISEDLCYVIFTSGSTGTPKGVMIKHSNVVNYCDSNQNNVCTEIIQNNYKKIISVTNFVFDIFVTESILPLLNGLTIYFTSDEEVNSQKEINRLIVENGIEILQTTPSKMKGYLFDERYKKYLSVLKVCILGGEALPAELVKTIQTDSDGEIYNIYGPAETTVWSSNAHITSDDITIGKPIANTQIYILDKQLNPVPMGVPGELCIAGEGVGLGYLNRPDLTEERFVPNPFATPDNHHGKIMYHTGDLAAWRSDGTISYLGRIDTQVKIRGLRIELGEIESVMSTYPGIRMCAVTDKKDENGRQYLVGYYNTASDENENQNPMTAIKINETELREYLLGKLPKYMVPNYFVHLSHIPMTASGKIDRKNLPEPNKQKAHNREIVSPKNATEERLLKIWQSIFELAEISTDDDFFEIGGDSLMAISLL